MSDYELTEDELEAMIESDYEDDELARFGEDDEAKRRHRRPVPVGKGAGYYKARPATRYVTQVQLSAAMAKVGKDVRANAVGLKTVGSRVDTATADIKKETTERQKEMAKARSAAQISALLPLITSRSATTTAAVAGIPAQTKLAVAPDAMMMLLPLMMSGDGLGGGSGGGDMSMMFMALALSGGLK